MAGLATAQVTVFSDNFDDNNRDGWYIFNQGTDTATRSLDVSNGYLETVSSGTFGIWGAAANFTSAADLSTIGNKVTITLDFQIVDDLGSNTITLGLYDSNGTAYTADTATVGAGGDDSGYHLFNRDDRYRTRDTSVGLGDVNGSNQIVANDPSTAATVASGLHTFFLELEKTASGIQVTHVLDAGTGNEKTMVGTSSIVLSSIDQIAIQAIRSDYWIDNVSVTASAVVPEPSSFALLAGMFGLTWIMLRRRG